MIMKNVGGIDRVLRIVAGLAIIGWGVYAQNWWGAVGAVPLLTGIIRWCPAYAPFGIKTCKVD
jgi:sulfite exporter TauE/SafE